MDRGARAKAPSNGKSRDDELAINRDDRDDTIVAREKKEKKRGKRGKKEKDATRDQRRIVEGGTTEAPVVRSMYSPRRPRKTRRQTEEPDHDCVTRERSSTASGDSDDLCSTRSNHHDRRRPRRRCPRCVYERSRTECVRSRAFVTARDWRAADQSAGTARYFQILSEGDRPRLRTIDLFELFLRRKKDEISFFF